MRVGTYLWRHKAIAMARREATVVRTEKPLWIPYCKADRSGLRGPPLEKTSSGFMGRASRRLSDGLLPIRSIVPLPQQHARCFLTAEANRLSTSFFDPEHYIDIRRGQPRKCERMRNQETKLRGLLSEALPLRGPDGSSRIMERTKQSD